MSKKPTCDEELMSLSMEDFMKLYAAYSSNSRKTLGAMYLRDLLEDFSTKDRPLSQKELGRLLEKYYNIRLERKALSRQLYTLSDERPLCIHITDRGSVYYDADEAAEYRAVRRSYPLAA